MATTIHRSRSSSSCRPRPAGIGDILPRLFAQKLAEAGNPATIVVENRPGGAGVIGDRRRRQGAARRLHAADGQSRRAGDVSASRQEPALRPVQELRAGRSCWSRCPTSWWCIRRSRRTRCQELIAYAKANPGKLSYASQGTGASGHIAAELLKLHAGIDIVHVPYKGAAPAAQDLAAGHVSMMFDVVSLALPQIKAGRVRRARRRGEGARRGAARRADPDRAGHAGRGRRLVRHAGAGRHAAGGHRLAQPRDHQGVLGAGHPRPLRAAGRRGAARHAGGVRPSSSRRNPTAMATSSSAPASSWNEPTPNRAAEPFRTASAAAGSRRRSASAMPHSTAIMIIGRGVPSANTP